jgi:hypothetical protein
MSEQQEARRQPRHRGAARAIPELGGRAPGVAGDDEGAQQRAQLDRVLEGRELYGHQPDDGAGKQHRNADLPAGIKSGADPGRGERGQQNDVGKIDRDQVRHLSVKAEQRDRARPQQMRAAPPRHGANLEILHPHEQQQKPEHRLDGNGYRKQGADLVQHGTTAMGGRVPMAQQGLAAGMQTMSEGDLAHAPRPRVKVDHLW